MANWLKENWFVLLAAAFLIGAFGEWPYSYYQLLRWVVCGVGAYTAYMASETGRTGWAWLFGGIAILFNPIMPFYFERETWQALDVLAAIPFVIFAFTKAKHDR